MKQVPMAEIDPKLRRANIRLALLLAAVAIGMLAMFIWTSGFQD